PRVPLCAFFRAGEEESESPKVIRVAERSSASRRFHATRAAPIVEKGDQFHRALQLLRNGIVSWLDVRGANVSRWRIRTCPITNRPKRWTSRRNGGRRRARSP